MNENATKVANCFVPEVVGPEIITKLTDDIKFMPFVKYRDTLKGTAGDTVTRWKYTYIGDAQEFTEGNDISYGKLTQVPSEVKIKKAGRGVELTDEVLLNAVGDPEAEAVRQIRLAIASKVDNDAKAALDGIVAQMTVGDGSVALGADLVQDALGKFGEDLEGAKAVLINPLQAKDIRKDSNFIPASEIKAEMMITGSLGQILGCDIVISNKVKNDGKGKYTNYLVKGQPLAVEVKRDIMPERARDINKKLTQCNADMHYVVYLEEDQNAVKIVSKDSNYVAPVTPDTE